MGKIRTIISLLLHKGGRVSYAQYGEDLIIQGIFDTMGLQTPRYIDIGTHHPTLLSNTYYFYERGSSGVCIEPSSELMKKIKRVRPRDICITAGIAAETKANVPYYVMTAQTMNTFSKEDAADTQNAPEVYGAQKVERTESIDLIAINDVLAQHFAKNGDLLSIDTEGFDEQIIHAIDFDRFRPLVICIESIEQSADKSFHKNETIIEYLKSKGYLHYADTYVNSIFVDRARWPLISHA